MQNIIDVNVEEYKTSNDKILVHLKNIEGEQFTEIKCFKNLEEILFFEAKKINLIKINKTFFLNLTSIQHLDLRDNKLLKMSDKLQNLKNLKILKLDDNSISVLPSYISNFDKLEYLSIANNKLKSLPTSLQYLHKMKTLKFSNNQISTIPIEFGLLKSLECLHMDANHFTEIPTTICYLKHLSELCFEWLEFLDPPFSKTIKESMGKTIISIIRNSLQEMIKQNILYCDYFSFLQRNSNSSSKKESEEKVNSKKNVQLSGDKVINSVDCHPLPSTNLSQKKLLKIFYAIEHNYYGVIKTITTSNPEYLTIKNGDNKYPLYLSIHNNKIEITNLLISKIDFSTVSNAHIYLHKAIRMRDPILTDKLIDMGIDVDLADDQGATAFHVLFSTFNKQFYKCSLIGDILLQKKCKLNALNNDNWAPIHIAARRASKECLLWIITQNKYLSKNDREVFALNMRGKNRWTPLHLAVNGFRLEESLILLQANCDVFAKNSDGKSPRKVANGNFLLTKLLRNYESLRMHDSYPDTRRHFLTNPNQNLFTTVEDNSHIDDYASFVREKKDPLASPPGETHSKKSKAAPVLQQDCESDNNARMPSPPKKKQSDRSVASFFSNDNVAQTRKSLVGSIKPTDPILKMKVPSKINLIPTSGRVQMKPFSENNLRNSQTRKGNKINLHFQKEILLNSDCDLSEKYEALMNIRMAAKSYHTGDYENIIKSILESLDLESPMNTPIFSDILGLTISSQLFDLIPFLEMLQKSCKKKRMNFLLDKELSCTIAILKQTQESFKKTTVMNNFSYTNLHKNSLVKSSLTKKKERLFHRPKSNVYLKQVNNTPLLKNINRYFDVSNLSSHSKPKKLTSSATYNEEGLANSGNENSYINLKNYTNSEPANVTDVNEAGNNRQQVDESCNVADSSWSMARYEDTQNELTNRNNPNSSYYVLNTRTDDVKCDSIKPDEDFFSVVPPKKREFFKIIN